MSASHDLLFTASHAPLLFHAERVEAPERYPASLDTANDGSASEALKEFEVLLEARSNEIAAVIIKPMLQPAGGLLVWKRGGLCMVRELCERHGLLLIGDEVMTGPGHSGKMFRLRILPDQA